MVVGTTYRPTTPEATRVLPFTTPTLISLLALLPAALPSITNSFSCARSCAEDEKARQVCTLVSSVEMRTMELLQLTFVVFACYLLISSVVIAAASDSSTDFKDLHENCAVWVS